MRFCKRNAVHGVRLWMKSVGLKGFTTPADNRGVMSWESRGQTVLKTKLFGLKVRHFNNSCLLIAFTRNNLALFSV